MRVAYLFFAYRNPVLMERTIKALSCENASFFIHVDAKSDLAKFREIRGENVHFVEQRTPVYWGEFSGVRAILTLIREALAGSKPHDYFVLLSGSEYPLQNAEYIHRFLEEHRGTEYISLVRVPNAEAGKPLSRINTLRFPSERPVFRFVARILTKLGMLSRDYRKYLGELEPYSGHTWWALSKEACGYICDFVERRPEIGRFFENTFAPEESFFHTIIGNSPFRANVRRNLVYEDWSSRGAHPAMISETHAGQFGKRDTVSQTDAYGAGEVLFARKLSDDRLDLVDLLEEVVIARRIDAEVPVAVGASIQ
jgi:hypothetical protein